MIDSLFIHTIKIERRTSSSFNSLGEPVYTYSTVAASQRARVEDLRGIFQYRVSGEHDASEVLVYVPPDCDVQLMDRIYYPTTALFATVKAIHNALLGSTSVLDHLELDLELYAG